MEGLERLIFGRSQAVARQVLASLQDDPETVAKVEAIVDAIADRIAVRLLERIALGDLEAQPADNPQ